MTIIIFIIILLVLVLIHEGGHFLAAKISGVRVDEFAFGFPPRLFSIKKGETTYAFNALPLGGYVKIYGENGDEEEKPESKLESLNTENKIEENESLKERGRSFVEKHPLLKIFILSAGVLMNLVLAYFLITISTYNSTNIVVDRENAEYNQLLKEGRIYNEQAVIVEVVKNSPASLAGLKPGYEVLKLFANQENSSGKIVAQKSLELSQTSEEIVEDISSNLNAENSKYNDSLTIVFRDTKGEIATTTIAGVYNLEGKSDKKMIGLALNKIAQAKLSLGKASKLGLERTVAYTKLTVVGFKDLITNLVSKGEFGENIAGPVGIAKEVGTARDLGFNYLLLFTAVLSISLAVFNILPFPALDGGRVLFVLIEWVTKKKISTKLQVILNGVGFVFLILLMIFVTIHDVGRFL